MLVWPSISSNLIIVVVGDVKDVEANVVVSSTYPRLNRNAASFSSNLVSSLFNSISQIAGHTDNK